MLRMRNIINDKFDVIRGRNPNATVGNLAAGTLILVLLAIFSVWYFGDRGGPEGLQNLLNRESEEMEQVLEMEENTVVVEQGEGLWQLTERVCGDGELYNHVAEENGMSIWTQLEVGQELIVSCNY